MIMMMIIIIIIIIIIITWQFIRAVTWQESLQWRRYMFCCSSILQHTAGGSFRWLTRRKRDCSLARFQTQCQWPFEGSRSSKMKVVGIACSVQRTVSPGGSGWACSKRWHADKELPRHVTHQGGGVAGNSCDRLSKTVGNWACTAELDRRRTNQQN